MSQVQGHCNGDNKHSTHPQGSQLGEGTQRRKAGAGHSPDCRVQGLGTGDNRAVPISLNG